MILYGDDIVQRHQRTHGHSQYLRQNIFQVRIEDFHRKNETMAFNVSEQMKAKESLISIGDVALKNVRTFKRLGHMIANNEKDPSHFPSFRISSAFQKWTELKHVLTDKRILKFWKLVRSRLLYSAQLNKIESIWHGFL